MTLAVAGLVLMGFNRMRVAGWAISDVAFMGSAAVICFQLLSGHTRSLASAAGRRGSTPVFVGTIVLLTAGTVSAFNSLDPGASIATTLRFGWITVIWFWVLRTVCRDRAALRSLLQGWRILILLSAVVAVVSHLGLVSWTVDNAENRQTGFFGHPNDLGGLLAVGLPILLLGLPQVPGRRRSTEVAARAAPCALVLYAISTTGSMSALLAAAAGVSVVALATWFFGSPAQHRPMNPLAVMVLGSLALVAATLLATSDLPVVERFTRYSEGDVQVQSSVQSRDERNTQVIARFDESLVIGRGFDGHDPADPGEAEAASAHNMFLRMLFQTGLPGVLGLFAILLFSLHHAARLLRNLRDDPLRASCLALLGALVTANTFAMFQPTEFQRYYWLPVALIGCLWALRKGELRLSGASTEGSAGPGSRRQARGLPEVGHPPEQVGSPPLG